MSDARELAAEPTGPLKGIRIVDLTTVVLGAYATQILGDLGAEVIKVETPAPKSGQGGDIMRWAGKAPSGKASGLGPIFMTINRNKRSVMLDLKKPAARAALMKLVRGADALLSNVRYDGLKRLGLSYDDVKKVKPDIVYVHAAGYGSDGPYAGFPAYDDLVQATSGMADLLSRVDGNPAPRYLPTLVADKATGLHMVYATTAALFHHARTGEGQFVEVPMLEAMTSFTLAEHFYGQVYEPPTGHWGYSRVLSPDRRPYKTADGHVAILPYSDQQWDDFFEVGGRPGLMQSDPRFATYEERTKNIRELYAQIEEITVTRTTADWLDTLRGLDIPAMPANRLDDLTTDPHLAATGFFAPYDHPSEGRYHNMAHPVRFAASPANIRRHAPALGADGRAVLAEAGLSEREIDDALGSEARATQTEDG